MRKIIFFNIIFLFFISFFINSVTSQTNYINVTNEVNGYVSNLTWGVTLNIYSPDENVRLDGLPKSGVTLGAIDLLIHSLFPTNTTTNPDFRNLDKWIAAAKANGLERHVYVAYTPPWLARNDPPVAGDIPNNFTRYMELVEIVVNHVKNDVKYYEIWGEPNLPYHWNGTAAEYREFLVMASQTIKRLDPDAVILAPGLSGIDTKWFDRDRVVEFISEVCVNASDYFDIFSFHNYPYPLDYWPMDNLKQMLNQYGCGDKPLWMTENSIWHTQVRWNYRDVLEKAKGIKTLLDYDVKAQVHFPFKILWSGGTWHGLYNATSKVFTPIGKYYQRAGQLGLKLYGDRLKINSNLQDSIGGISFIVVKNEDNKIVLQLTNNYSTPQQVQINFPYPKKIAVYESSADNDLDTEIYSVANSKFDLTLKPYSVYLIGADSIGFSGQLRNNTGIINANVSIYNSGKNTINISQITTNGNYNIPTWPNVYDIQFNILNFFIQNFWIKLMSINTNSNIVEPINYVNGYYSENKLSFKVNISGDQEIRVYSNYDPKSVKMNGFEMTRVYSRSELTKSKWFYNPSEGIIYLIATLCSDGTQYGNCSSSKPLYCDNGNLVNKCTQCSCPSDYVCNSATDICEPTPTIVVFEDGFDLGNFGSWTGTFGSPSIVSTQKQSGTYSSENDASGDYVYKEFSGQSKVFVRGYFRFSSLPASGNQVRVLRLFYGNGWGTTVAQLTLEWTGAYGLTLDLITNDSTFSSPVSLNTNTWYPFEIEFVKDPVNGEYHVWIGGNELTSMTGLDTSRYGDTAKLWVGNMYSNYATTVWVDSVKVSNKYIGP